MQIFETTCNNDGRTFGSFARLWMSSIFGSYFLTLCCLCKFIVILASFERGHNFADARILGVRDLHFTFRFRFPRTCCICNYGIYPFYSDLTILWRNSTKKRLPHDSLPRGRSEFPESKMLWITTAFPPLFFHFFHLLFQILFRVIVGFLICFSWGVFILSSFDMFIVNSPISMPFPSKTFNSIDFSASVSATKFIFFFCIISTLIYIAFIYIFFPFYYGYRLIKKNNDHERMCAEECTYMKVSFTSRPTAV